MCRQILAFGRIEAKAILEAAIAMGQGKTACHEKPEARHQHGWGCAWKPIDAPESLQVYRSTKPIYEDPDLHNLESIRASFLAIHMRDASLVPSRGLAYTHPITRDDTEVKWYITHNGALTQLCSMVDPPTDFDTMAYFQYVIPKVGNYIDVTAFQNKLDNLPPGGTSANAFIFNPARAYIVNWFPEDSPCPNYYQMKVCTTTDAFYVASDRLPTIAPDQHWENLPNKTVLVKELF